MKKLILFLFLSAIGFAQVVTPPVVASDLTGNTVSRMPLAGRANRIWIVTDGNSSSDCSVGGGSNVVVCRDSGSSWSTLLSTVSSSGTTNALAKYTSANVLGSSVITDDGTTAALGTAFTVTESTGIPAKVANLATAGVGVGVVVALVNLPNQTAAIASTPLLVSAPAGVYMICQYIHVTVIGTATSIQGFNNYTTDGISRSTSATGVVSAASTNGESSLCFQFYSDNATINYQTLDNGTGTYRFVATLLRLQ